MEFQKVFQGDGSTFGALYEAEKWLRDNGYSYGPSCVTYPRAVFKGDCYVAKWRNLTPKERSQADGTLHCGRDRPAVLRLKEAPKHPVADLKKLDGWNIEKNVKPIPDRSHDYDGADGGNGLCGTAGSIHDAELQIAEIERERS